MVFDIGNFSMRENIGKYPLPLDAGITKMYVYSDLASSYLVNNMFAPFLRIVTDLIENGGWRKNDIHSGKTVPFDIYYPIYP